MYLSVGLLAAALLAWGTACRMPLPADKAAEAVAAATGLRGAIRFETNTAAVDLPGGTNTLTLSDAVRQAVVAAPEVQMALARARGAQAESWQARQFPNPVLHILFRLPEGGGATAIETGIATDLAQWLRRPHRIAAADHRLRAAAADAVAAALDIIEATETHYAGHLAHSEAIKLLRLRQSVLSQLRDLAQRRLDAGEGTRLDVIALDAQLEEAQADLSEHWLKLESERLSLARLLGEPSRSVELQLGTPLAEPSPLVPEAVWIAHALQRRPEIQSARWELAARGDDHALARLAWLSEFGGGLAAERESDWSLGPSATVPLPFFDTGEAAQSKAQASLIEARHQTTLHLRRTVTAVRHAHAAHEALQRAAVQVREKLLPLQAERARLARAVYEAGQSDITPVRFAELDLQAARLRLLELQLRLSVAASQLRRASGGPLAPSQP